MTRIVRLWLQKKMADVQLVFLLSFITLTLFAIMLVGSALSPLFVAIALAYVMDDAVALLQGLRIPRLVAVLTVFLLTFALLIFAVLAILPLLFEQLSVIVHHLPDYIKGLHQWAKDWHESTGYNINPVYMQQGITAAIAKAQEFGTALLSLSLAGLPNLFSLSIFLVIVPVLVFFLLKDKEAMQVWALRFLPKERDLLAEVWSELDIQIGNYIRGKFWEMMIVGVVTWLGLIWFAHPYATLLAVLTAVSVWVPFVGIVIVGLLACILTLMQWGLNDVTMTCLLVYAIIQLLDANVLVPWLFSEVVNLHPIAIIVAILMFGSLWGLLGVFLAIPLAALVQIVLQKSMSRSIKAGDSSMPAVES